MHKCTYVDGIASSQAIDTAGEIVDLKGLDCSSLLGAPMNWEHKSDTPAQIVGKILEYKKIFSEQDCDTERQLYYWNKCKIPFLYCLGRLFDDKKDSSKEAAALFKDDAENPNEPAMVGFSIEGAKVHKEGMTITRSIARKLTITALPANKTCVAQMVPSDHSDKKNDIDSLFKGEVEFFKPSSKYLEFLQKKEEDMAKDVGTGEGAFIGSQLAMSELQKALPNWSAPKQSQGALHFKHPEHGTVSIHKQPSGEFHVKHNGATAGLKGIKGSFKTPQEAGKHAQSYMSSLSAGKTAGNKLHNRPSPSMLGKAMDAGSGLSAPSERTQGAALSKEDKLNAPLFTHTPGNKMTPGIKSGMGMSNMGHKVRSGDIDRAKQIASKTLKKKSKWLARAEEAYSKWEKKEHFQNFMAKKMPHLTKGEIDSIGKVIALKKHVDAENTLAKIYTSYLENMEKGALKFGSPEDQKAISDANEERKKNPPKKTPEKPKSPRLKGVVHSEVSHTTSHGGTEHGKYEVVHLKSGHELSGHPVGKFKAGDKVVAKPHIMGTHILEHKKD